MICGAWVCKKTQVAIVVSGFLDCRRWADMKRKDDAARFADNVRGNYESGSDKKWDRPVNRAGQDSGVRHRANRALVAGNLGVFSVYVGRLNKADEADQKNTQQRQEHYILVSARLIFKSNQTERPNSVVYTPNLPFRCAEFQLVACPKFQSPKSSRSRLVCARLTGISVCFLSSRRS
jgi:hypothetical protein